MKTRLNFSHCNSIRQCLSGRTLGFHLKPITSLCKGDMEDHCMSPISSLYGQFIAPTWFSVTYAYVVLLLSLKSCSQHSPSLASYYAISLVSFSRAFRILNFGLLLFSFSVSTYSLLPHQQTHQEQQTAFLKVMTDFRMVKTQWSSPSILPDPTLPFAELMSFSSLHRLRFQNTPFTIYLHPSLQPSPCSSSV